MRGAFLVMLVLAGLLALLQYQFWFGRASSGDVLKLEERVESQRRANAGLLERNAELAAEVEDLKSGEAAVEERARSELGMIKPGEKFYRVVESPAAAPSPLPEPAAEAAR